MSKKSEIRKVASLHAEAEGCDVLLLCGELSDSSFERLKKSCNSRARRNKLLLVLFTLGGDAHAAYRMGRCLQRKYDEVHILVNGRCKSAGTILAISAHKLTIADDGELGPLDVQQMRQDELWERSSGLVEGAAINSLSETAWELFERLITEIKDLSFGRITFKTAADAVSPIVAGTLSPIFAQIDPLKLGETARALSVARQYALLLDKVSRNLQNMAIEKLVAGYPDHGFIIDREEAATLFHRVEEPVEILKTLSDKLGNLNPTQAVTAFLDYETPAEEPNMEMQDGIAETRNGTEESDYGPPSTRGDMADAEENQASVGGNGAAGD